MNNILSIVGWLLLLLIACWSWAIGIGAMWWSGMGGGNAKGEATAIIAVASFLSWLCWYSSPLSLTLKAVS